MAYRGEVGPKARAQLDELDPIVGSAVERKIIWLAQNADVMIHRRLVGMHDDLAGLCKLRVGDWRILYLDLSRGENRAHVSHSAPLRSVSGSLRCLFIMEGEQHSWVHVTINRFTGRVLDKQIEVVNE
jgi:mRNA-degrading endonuclease RelE of RelBE toxin-antitoxin system